MLVLVVAAAIQCANGKSLAETAWSLLPPVIAIVLALVSKEAFPKIEVNVYNLYLSCRLHGLFQ